MIVKVVGSLLIRKRSATGGKRARQTRRKIEIKDYHYCTMLNLFASLPIARSVEEKVSKMLAEIPYLNMVRKPS